ncbi:MAG: hypothetical protein JTT11_01670 [Candidatus Brockarchaeota archaeon]|nr:hypothetical protein [Candidatus Brockarchaeota archaeon]
MPSLEGFSFVAIRFGFQYPKMRLRNYWERLLFNQVHDDIDSTSAEAVYQDVAIDLIKRME